MNKFRFLELPTEYQVKVHYLHDEILQRIYSNTNFLYFRCELSNIEQQNKVESFIYDYLKSYKFITYQFFPLLKPDLTNDNITSVICVEGHCIINEQMDEQLLIKIIDDLKKEQISILNVSNDSTTEENDVSTEITNFCNYFKKEIENNEFVKKTINSIAGFLIRRYFYPSDYFKDPSFFSFNQSILQSKENRVKTKIKKYCSSVKNNYFQEIFDELRPSNDYSDNLIQIQNFNENDFIVLRKICNNEYYIFSLVIHIKSLYLFSMKQKIDFETSNLFKRETFFCQNYSNNFLTPFYGFLKKENEIIGFIYEFMSNGSLNSFILNNEKIANDLYLLITITRVFQGIEYLHLNKLIYRDLKPSNILIDHDYKPYISDFETICEISAINKIDGSVMTNEYGSYYYLSPEQESDLYYSFPTDIYSFGLIIYFLFEKKHMLENLSPSKCVEFKKSGKIKHMTKGPKTLQNLFQSCAKYSPSDRPNNEEIKNIIINEFNNFSYLESYLLNETKEIQISLLFQYLYEGFFIQISNYKPIHIFIDVINAFRIIFYSKINEDYSKFCFSLGSIYEYKYFTCINQDFLKSRYYYELSAKEGNALANYRLGLYYENGYGVQRNYLKAKEYYEIAGKMNYSKALYNIGDFYDKGLGVTQNFEKAIEYYKLSIQIDNNSNANNSLGDIYRYGKGVKQDYFKAIECYDSSILKNDENSHIALNSLGELYLNGFGVKQDYLKAKELFEMSAKSKNKYALLNLGKIYQNNYQNYEKAINYFEQSASLNCSDAFNCLGKLYLIGQGVIQDSSRAKEYFELSAQLNNSDALLNLGILYQKGMGVEKDYLKAKEYFEKSSKLNNSDAFIYLGKLYLSGHGVQKDQSKAIEYFELSKKHQSNFESNSTNLREIENYYAKKDLKGISIFGDFYLKGYGVQQDYEKAKYYYELSSLSNDPIAFLNLGLLYEKGLGVKQNLLKAKYYYELSAKLNNSTACLYLGNFYKYGCGVKQDFVKAKEYYELAKHDHSIALNNIGDFYINGQGVEVNYSKAKEYYELAANKNNPEAIINLGNIYMDGLGVEKEYFKAVDYYLKAEKMKYPKSYIYIGRLYENGIKFKQDYIKAKDYYELAIKNNVFEGFFYLGKLYENGFGVRKNISFAKQLFQIAADKKHSQSLITLAKHHLYESNFTKAIECYELAAEQNNPKAFLYLGNFYMTGFIVEKNITKAKNFYELAAQQNDSEALNNLGICYLNGYGVVTDIPKAKKYFVKAAEMNNLDALFNLAKLYEDEKNYSKAIENYELAAIQNHPESLLKLGLFYEEGNGVEKNFKKSLDCYESAAKLYYPKAFYFLGDIYLNVIKDYKKAVKYYEIASQLNHQDSSFMLGYLYSNGYEIDVDIQKSIYYYLRCINIQNKVYIVNDEIITHYSRFYYISCNDLGLIFLINLNDIQKASFYIKEAAFAEYSFAQNSFGLLNLLYYKKIDIAEHMFTRASKNNFALSYYNLGYLKEKEGEIEKSIEYYIKASENEDKFLNFYDIKMNDLRYDISTKFVLCLVNLKLVIFYISKADFEQSKKYFAKALDRFLKPLTISERKIVKFKLNFGDSKNILSSIKSLIFNFADFNLQSQNNLNHLYQKYLHEYDDENQLVFEKPNKLFDFVNENDILFELFIDEIQDIIHIMTSILYTPPYSILFGRISLERPNISKSKENLYSYMKDINESFYEGFLRTS